MSQAPALVRVARTRTLAGLLAGLGAALVLGGCGRTGGSDGETAVSATPSSGQVAAPPAVARVDFYAASRLAEQASFGPTPALVAAIQARGMAGWIDDQLDLPASQIDLTPFLVDPVPNMDWEDSKAAFPDLALRAPDQLRLRVAWVLSQWVTVNTGDALGMLVFQNLLVARSLDTFEQLLVDVSTNAHVGHTLDLVGNRPRTGGCAACAPNHNYARVLLEQFTLGTAELDANGQPVRDARGRPRPAYSERDVRELTRALTGWEFRAHPSGGQHLPRDWGNWREPMVASNWPGDRDFGAKQLLGVAVPAYQSAADELRQVIGILAAHPNTRWRLARHLIQGLVKDQPSPEYLQRVVSAYADNGKGVRGDLRALVRAVLLDPEARAGDDQARARPDDGRIRENFLVASAIYRAVGCQRVPRWEWGGPRLHQVPFHPPSPRGFVDSDDRTPVTHLNVPAQRALNASEFNQRSGMGTWLVDYWRTRPDTGSASAAGCNVDDMVARYQRSTAEYYAWLGDRFFRGSLPPALRQSLDQLIRIRHWDETVPVEPPVRLLSFALLWPNFGVIE